MEFKILSGGAAHGLFQAVAAEFLAAKGLSQNSSFGAVGGVRERLLDGEKADIVILTEAIMAELAASGIVQATRCA